MEKIKNLLQQVSTIQKKYDDLAEYSGEHYNIFDILGIRNSELSHSAILTNLLDAKGKHGQKDVFLKLFLEQIDGRFEKLEYNNYFINSETINSTAKKEVNLGGVNLETGEGGRVDIIITSGNKNIVIENKIYAGDQDKQLLRYNNHYKNQPIIYLTREGNPPSITSRGDLILGKDFICCSYEYDIKNWLGKCIKEMVNKPIIRETLNQYLFLIKSLTNQSNNNKMSEEITSIILKDESSFESFIEINKISYNIKKEILIKILPNLLENLSLKYNFKLVWNKNDICSDFAPVYCGFYFTNEILEKNNLIFNFEFQGNCHKNLIYGFTFIDLKNKNEFNTVEIISGFRNIFGVSKSSDAWLCYKNYDEYYDWNNLDTLKNIYFKNFEEDLEIKLKSVSEFLKKHL